MSQTNKNFRPSVAIVGGGLVGALEACYMAKRGFQVTLFEGRRDGRHEVGYYGRSINLALSLRGTKALERIECAEVVKSSAIPMKNRMIHGKSGKPVPIPYDPAEGRALNSIQRASLNNFLLNKAEEEYKIEVLFERRLVDMEPNSGILYFRVGKDEEKLEKRQFDLILGCDGAKSAVRQLLAKSSVIEVSQSYIDHGYLELHMTPDEEGDFKMEPNNLHIWPRGQFMMIALPNQDRSFTCTLFCPFAILETLKEPEAGLAFFEENFPDSIPLLGEDHIKERLAKGRPSPLVSIRCKPYFGAGKVALLGDSAHAMVPFYGQGMNCGFEDCLVLDELIEAANLADADGFSDRETWPQKIEQVLSEYSERRCPNGLAMGELAMYNYIEMRDLVNTISYRARKKLDELLFAIFPNYWIPLYTMVTFTQIPVDQCLARRRKQDEILARSRRLLLLASGLIALVCASKSPKSIPTWIANLLHRA